MKPIRILIADDHALFRDALRRLLEGEPGFLVVGEAGNGRETLEQLDKEQPDLLILDLDMPQQSGLEVLRKLAAKRVEVRTILLVASIERHQIVEALRLGACGVVLKDTTSRLLYKSIRAVMSGEFWVDHGSVVDLVETLRSVTLPAHEAVPPSTFGLTRREFEILLTIVDGYTNKDIAEKFLISEQTVKHHLTSIFEKVGVANRLELALFAVNHRLISEA